MHVDVILRLLIVKTVIMSVAMKIYVGGDEIKKIRGP